VDLLIFAKDYIILSEVSFKSLLPLGESLVLPSSNLAFSILLETIGRQLQDKLLILLKTTQRVLILINL